VEPEPARPERLVGERVGDLEATSRQRLQGGGRVLDLELDLEAEAADREVPAGPSWSVTTTG
jgi:hypothetical protein